MTPFTNSAVKVKVLVDLIEDMLPSVASLYRAAGEDQAKLRQCSPVATLCRLGIFYDRI